MNQSFFAPDPTAVAGFAKALAAAPALMIRELAKAYGAMGVSDIARVRAMVNTKLKRRAGGAPNTFHYVASDPSRAKSVESLFEDVYTKWEAAASFEVGGIIKSAAGKYLTVLQEAAYNSDGSRKYGDGEIQQLVRSGKARLISTTKGLMIVLVKQSKSKKKPGEKLGGVIAVLKKQVKMPKLLDFFKMIEANESMRQDLIEDAVEDVLVEIATKTP